MMSIMLSEPTPLLIMGMHRSGTSCLTGCLQEAGLFLGTVNDRAPFNPKGNKENRQVMDLHDSILRRVNASWDQPPVFDPLWTHGEIHTLGRIIDDYRAVERWGVKDPRSLFMVPGWRQICDPKFVGTFRNPVDVATSLMRRAQAWQQPMSAVQAYALWECYNQRLIELHNEHSFPIVRYDVQGHIYRKKIYKIIEVFDLNIDVNVAFRDDNLYHECDKAASMPAALKLLWDNLNDIAI